MITDEQIIQIAKDTKSAEPGRDGYILPISFARELIALAQQVKPLEFVQGSSSSTKHAHTQFGTYSLCGYVDEVRLALPEELNYFRRGYTTEAEAIEAANADYQRRVLSCLVHGGV